MVAPAFEQILEIQALDLRLRQLKHRLANHPLLEELAVTKQEVTGLASEVSAIEARKHGLERDLKRLSDEVATLEVKRQDIETKLYDGSVTASGDLLAMQGEGASLLSRQQGLEDQELEIMEEMEGVGADLAEAGSRLTALAENRDDIEQRLADATVELESEMAAVAEDRARQVEPANPALLATYERLASELDGVAVARFVDGRCDGCHMQLSAMAADQLNRASDDEAVNCEECGRLLVR